MAEKNMHSFPPARAPKSQLVVKTTIKYEDTGTHQIKFSQVQRQRRSFNEMVRVAQSHTGQVGDPQSGEQQYQRSSLTVVKVQSPMSGFPAWGLEKGTENPQGIWPWRPAGFDYSTCTGRGGWWGSETPVSRGTDQILPALRPRGKEQWPHRKLSQTYILVLEGLLQRSGWTVAHHEDGSPPVLGGVLGVSPLGGHH